MTYIKDIQYYKFCFYGFFKNLRFFEPFLIFFFLEKGLSYLEIGILYSTREILRNIFEIPSGIIADLLGRRKTLAQSFVFYIISFILFYTSYEYWTLLLAMGAYAFGDAFRTGTNKAMIFSYLETHGWEDQKVDYYGHTRSCSQMGSALSALIAAVIVFNTGSFQTIFLFSTIPYILDFILVLSYPKSLEGEIKHKRSDKLSLVFREVVHTYFNQIKKKKTIRTILNLSVSTGYYKAVKDYLQAIILTIVVSSSLFINLSDHKRTALLTGVIYSVLYFLNSGISRKSGYINRIFKSYKQSMNITFITGVASGLIAGIFILLEFPILSVILFLIVLMIENLRKPVGVSIIAEQTEKETLATTLSTESQTNSLVAALIAPSIGYLADTFSLGYALLFIPIILLSVFPLFKLKSN